MIVLFIFVGLVYVLKLKTRDINGKLHDSRGARMVETEPQLYIFQFHENLVRAKKRSLLKEYGVEHNLGFIHKDAYVIKLKPEDRDKFLEHVQDVDFLLESDKSFLNFREEYDGMIGNSAEIELTVQLYEKDPKMEQFQDLLNLGVTISFSDNYMIVKNIQDGPTARAVVELLKRRNDVIWIDRELPVTTKNYGINTIFQTKSGDSFRFKLWKQGLNGTGQLVGVMDSGIQPNNCFFYDRVNGNNFGDNHRKIQSTMEEIDSNGHGTHVCGTIAGNTNSDDPFLQKFNGVAKAARLIVQGLTATTINNVTGLLQDAFNEGARIHSNSWGTDFARVGLSCKFDCNCSNTTTGMPISDQFCIDTLGNGKPCCYGINTYSFGAREFDKFLYENQDMVASIAAGNDGTVGRKGMLEAPATAKNPLAVGASVTTHEDWQDVVNVTSRIQCYDQYYDWCVEGSCDPPVDIATMCANACPSYKNEWCPSHFRAIVNNYSTSAEHTRYYLADFSSKGPSFDGRMGVDLVAPGNKIVSARSNKNDSDPVLAKEYCGYEDLTYHQPYEYPASDAKFWDVFLNYSLTGMEGTSMATPATSGLLALLRQYLVDGYYPTGRPIISNKMIPSGVLLKTLILHTSEIDAVTNHIMGNKTNLRILNEAQGNGQWSDYVGFGLPQPHHFLVLDNVKPQTSNYILKLIDRVDVKEDETTIHPNQKCYHATSSKNNLTVTMGFYDAPSTQFATSLTVNDLLLTVKEYSNYASPASSTLTNTYNGNGIAGTNGDTLNTVEKVKLLDQSTLNYFCIGVKGVTINSGVRQNFSVVISADFYEEVDVSFECNSLPKNNVNSCGVLGKCISPSTCLCNDDNSGIGGDGKCQCNTGYSISGSVCVADPPSDVSSGLIMNGIEMLLLFVMMMFLI